MSNKIIPLLFAIFIIPFVCCMNGCNKEAKKTDGATLIRAVDGTLFMEIRKTEWMAMHYKTGYQTFNHFIFFSGNGTSFKDGQIRIKGPDEAPVLGTVSIDVSKNKVVVDINRIVSEKGESVKTVPYSANGVYSINVNPIEEKDFRYTNN